MLDRFRYLKVSLVFVLAYIGVKMLLAHSHAIPASVSLAIVAGILGVGLLASLWVAAVTRSRPRISKRPLDRNRR
jgi:tellurite resistance protein TerC